MTLERVTKLIKAMEDNAWVLRNMAIDHNETPMRIAQTDERWMTLFAVVKILSNDEYAEKLWNIFITDDEDDEDDGDEGEEATEYA